MQVACKSQRCIWDTSVKALNALSIHLASSARAKRETLLPLLLLQTLQRCRLATPLSRLHCDSRRAASLRAVSTSTLPQRHEVVAGNAATAPEKARAAEVRAAPAIPPVTAIPAQGATPSLPDNGQVTLGRCQLRQLATDVLVLTASPRPRARARDRRPRTAPGRSSCP